MPSPKCWGAVSGPAGRVRPRPAAPSEPDPLLLTDLRTDHRPGGAEVWSLAGSHTRTTGTPL